MMPSAAEYLQNRVDPAAAAVQVVLQALAPGRYRVQPMDTYDGAGNRLYALIDDLDGERYAVAGRTIGGLLFWIGERADDQTTATRPLMETAHGSVYLDR